jgi:glycosyltransferase involved in cell wall biosynthesis
LAKYSIVTSLYNCENFINSYFETIFSQKILPNEIILIDDTNNPFNLSEILKKKKNFYNFQNIFLIKNNENLGPAISLNKGINICRNDLIFRLDVDDLWSPDHTLKMINIWNENPNYLIYANSQKKKNFLTNLKCDDYLINENHLIHSSWLINKKICKNFKYRMLKTKIGPEDYFTLLFYSRNYKFFWNYDNTVRYMDSINSRSKISSLNKNYLRIRNRISRYFFYINIKKKNFFQKIYFIFFKFGIIKFLIFIILYY